MTKRPNLTYFILTFILLFITPLIFLSFAFAKTGKNTKIDGIDYSLLNKSQIIAKLDQDFIFPKTISFRDGDRQISLSTASFSASVNHNEMASTLLFRRLNHGILKYIRDFFSPQSFSLAVKFDANQLDQVINDINVQINTPFVPTELELGQNTINVKNGQIGRQVDNQALKQKVIESLGLYDFSPISIPVNPIGTLPTVDEVSLAEATAQKLVGKSLVLNTPDQSLTLDTSILIPMVGFKDYCQQDKIKNYLTSFQDTLKKDATDAVFKFENNKVIDFVASSDGYKLDLDASVILVCQKMTELASQSEKSLSFTTPIITLKPKVVTADVNNLGIKELIGSGTSTFHHSNDTRNFNVQKGSSIVNRILVAPGDTFSFIKNLGEVTVSSGYKQAYIIRQGHTVLDAGGGICQVSTTLFRAMLDAGLNITERQNHAYRVSYYEEDSKPGFDATVFIPSPDLKFVNDTGHYVLIQNTFDLKNRRLTYYIYGTSDGRKAEISNYRSWDATPAPPDINIDDPTLPPGKTVQDEHAIAGLKTAFDWKVVRDGQIIHQKTFQSVFVPWAAVYRHGVTATN